jgi:hypothetical protein
MSRFLPMAQQIGELVERKNAAYGSSFEKSGPALRLLFPEGIPPAQMEDALLLARIWDKMQRIATDRDALGESPYRDIAGYGILGAALHESRKEDQSIETGSCGSELPQAVPVSGMHSANGRRKAVLLDGASHSGLEGSAQKGRNKNLPTLRRAVRKEARAAAQSILGGRDGKSHQ